MSLLIRICLYPSIKYCTMAKRKNGKPLSDYVTDTPKIKPLDNLDADTQEFIREVIHLTSITIRHFEKVYHPEWIQGYYDKNLYMGERYMKLLKTNMYRRSNDCFPLTASSHEVYVSNAFNQEDNIIVSPVEEMDNDKAKIWEMVNKWIFSMAEIKETLQMMVDESTLIWNSFCRLSVNKYKDEIRYLKDWIVKSETREYCNPALTYVSPFSIFREPWARSFKQASYWIYRRIMRMDEAAEYYNKIFPGWINITQEERDIIQNHWEKASEYDYERVKDIAYYSTNLKRCRREELKNNGNIDSSFDFSVSENDIYQVDRDSNNNIEIIEYREKDKCAILFNCLCVYAWPSIYPFDDCPFEHLWFEMTPGFAVAKWIAQKNKPFQTAINEFHNSYIDALRMISSPMFKMPRAIKWKKVFDYIGRGIVESSSLSDIERVDIIDFNTVGQLQNAKIQTQSESDRALWLNSYTAGWEWNTERSATGTTARQQVTQVKLIPFRKNINKLLTSCSAKFMIMARNDFNQKFIIKVVWKENEITFKEISTEDLINKFDIQYQYSNLAWEEVRRLQNIELLKTILPANMDPMRNRPIADVSLLIKEILANSWLLNKDIVPNDAKRVEIAKNLIEFNETMQEIMPTPPEPEQAPPGMPWAGQDQAQQPAWPEDASWIQEVLQSIQNNPGAPDATAQLNKETSQPVANVWRKRQYLSQGDVLAQANRTV